MPGSGVNAAQPVDWLAILTALAPYFVALVALVGHILNYRKKRRQSLTSAENGDLTSAGLYEGLTAFIILIVLIVGVIGMLSIVDRNSDLASSNQELSAKLDKNRESISQLSLSVDGLSNNITRQQINLYDTIYAQADTIRSLARDLNAVLSSAETVDPKTGKLMIPSAVKKGIAQGLPSGTMITLMQQDQKVTPESVDQPAVSDKLVIEKEGKDWPSITLKGTVPESDKPVWVAVHPVDTETYYVEPTETDGNNWSAVINLEKLGKQSTLYEVRALADPKGDLEHYRSFFKWPEAALYSRTITVERGKQADR
jgi:hypothetical protein